MLWAEPTVKSHASVEAGARDPGPREHGEDVVVAARCAAAAVVAQGGEPAPARAIAWPRALRSERSATAYVWPSRKLTAGWISRSVAGRARRVARRARSR